MCFHNVNVTPVSPWLPMKVTYVGQNEENLEPCTAVHQLFNKGARKGILLA